MLRFLIGLHVVIFVGALVIAFYMMNDTRLVLLIAGGVALITIGGGLAAYFYYKRGKFYEERGESGPDG